MSGGKFHIKDECSDVEGFKRECTKFANTLGIVRN